jgi:hypothetical protein
MNSTPAASNDKYWRPDRRLIAARTGEGRVHAIFGNLTAGETRPAKASCRFGYSFSGWTNEICDQILTLRKGDEVEIKASVMTLGTFRKSETPYLCVFARSVRKVGAEQSWPAKIEQPARCIDRTGRCVATAKRAEPGPRQMPPAAEKAQEPRPVPPPDIFGTAIKGC